MYTYSDLNDYLHQYMKKKGQFTTNEKKDEVYYINLTFVLSTYKILIQIDNNYELDLRNSKFGELIGFTEKTVKKTEYGGGDLPNIRYIKFRRCDLYQYRCHYKRHFERC